METVRRRCQTIWADYCCRRNHHEEEAGSYSLLRNPKMITSSSSTKQKKKSRVAPQGCFCVYVGPERKRFVIKIELTNHPRFRTLLEDAENEYGTHNDGPIWLPCDVHVFSTALAEMETTDYDSSDFHSAKSSRRPHKKSWGRRLFKIPRAPNFRINDGL